MTASQHPETRAQDAQGGGAAPSATPGGQTPFSSRYGAAGARSKYNAQPTMANGIRFASRREFERWTRLVLADRSGEISNLRLQVAYPLVVNGQKIGSYVADFVYVRDGREVVEDVKSEPTKTAVYRLKKRLMRACHGIEITEVT